MKRRIIILALAFIFSFMCLEYSWALIRPSARQVEEYRRDGSWQRRVATARQLGLHRVSPALIAGVRERLQNLAEHRQGPVAANKYDWSFNMGPSVPLAWLPQSLRRLPSTGTVKIFVLLISFADQPNYFSSDYIRGRLYGSPPGGYPYESVRNYYLRSSYDRLDIQGDILGWYQAPYPRANVAPDNAEYTQEYARNGENLIKEALTYFDDRGHDFSQYDNDGDGVIDYFIVLWTGPEAGWADFWWAYNVDFRDQNFKVDGTSPGNYSWQAEKENTGTEFQVATIIHETGHALGLPDYYDYEENYGPNGGVGGMDMMDSSDGDHNSFSKFLLGWLEPASITSGIQTVSLAPSASAPDAAIVMPGFDPLAPYKEFFMIQNRFPIGNDTGFTYPGLVIWHVDAQLNSSGTDFRYDNSYTIHKLLRLMEADGLEEIETAGSIYDAGDFYTAGSLFGPISSPSSGKYSGTASGIMIDRIELDNQQVSASVSVQNLAKIGLSVERKEERSWMALKAYAQLDISVELTGGGDGNFRYVIYRKESGEQFQAIQELDYSQFEGNTLTYYDKYFPVDRSYTYIVVAYDPGDNLVGTSPERQIKGEDQ